MLVADGELERVAVEDGGADVFVPAGADLDPPRPTVAVLLSPFDNLLWDRPFAKRVLGFEHVIEVYKRAPQRRYGYYVLPFLWRTASSAGSTSSPSGRGRARREGGATSSRASADRPRSTTRSTSALDRLRRIDRARGVAR